VARSKLYHDRYGYRSGVNRAIRGNLAEIVREGLEWMPSGTSWLDIASNDGTLLSNVPRHWVRVGVDPVVAFANEARAHANRIFADYFSPHLFRPSETFDVITSISMFYDLHEPDQFVRGVAKILSGRGVWIIQQNYLVDMLDTSAFDNVCHEHLAYYSLRSLEPLLHRHGLQVVHVSRTPINGGCFRTVVAHMGAYLPDSSVHFLRDFEALPAMEGIDEWDRFRRNVGRIVKNIRDKVSEANLAGRPVYIYGASTRGAVIWQAAKLGWPHVLAAVEAQEQKVGKYYSAVDGLRIISEETMRSARPGLVLVGPYWHKQMFLERERGYLARGGQMLFPLPQFEVVSGGPERDLSTRNA
jgi:hypothetical protein